MENTPISLQTFKLDDLAPFSREKCFASNASPDVHWFYVGRDDVHGILKYLLERATSSIYLNMFGYDDAELNEIIMDKIADPHITVMITLDKSQAGGVAERKLLDADKAKSLEDFNSHFAIGQSATHQITHTKGFVIDGRVAVEGSTNWSMSGEGTFVIPGQCGGVGYKAQNNTLTVCVDPDTIARFTSQLIAEHMVAVKQAAAKAKAA